MAHPSSLSAVMTEMVSGDAYLAASDSERALRHYEKAMMLCGASDGPHTLTLWFASLLRKLGCCYPRDPSYSLMLLDRSRGITGRLSLVHTDGEVFAQEIALCEEDRGCSLAKLGRTTEAIAALESALLNFGKTNDEAGVLAVTIKLSEEYETTGDYEKGLQILSRAEALCALPHEGIRALTRERIDVASSRGSCLLGLRRFDEALNSFQSALSLTRAQYGDVSYESASGITDIATAHARRGHVKLAEEGFRSARNLFEQLGKTHTVPFAKALVNLGASVSDHDEALKCYEQALAILRTLLPPGHPDFAGVLQNMATLHRKRGDAGAEAASRSSLNAIQRRSQTFCSGPGCTKKLRGDGAPLDVCVKCRRTFYCGKACQTADWKAGHRAECKALIAEAAGAAATKRVGGGLGGM